jgi:hypothetical protein
MLELDFFVDYTGSGVGFIVPVFSRYPGANLIFVQSVDNDNLIEAFQEIRADHRYRVSSQERLSREIGMPAIWAFAAPDGTVHCQPATGVHEVLRTLLSTRALENHPLALAELVQFCDAEESNADALRHAYERLADQSHETADIWRDTCILLPIARRELGARLKPRERRELLPLISAQSDSARLSLFIPDEILGVAEHSTLRTGNVAKIFGINQVRIYPTILDSAPSRPPEDILIRGFGGVGRWSITTSPLKGDIRVDGSTGLKYAVASVPLTGSSDLQLDIAIHGSEPREVNKIRSLLTRLERPNALKHAINVRPLSYYQEQRRFLRPTDIAGERPELDYTWIIANHRQRRNTNVGVGLAMSNFAARFVRANVLALAALNSSSAGINRLALTRRARGLGLVGATRFFANLSPEALIRRALYTMINEDAALHTAEQIWCFWPYRDVPHETVDVRIGQHNYHTLLHRGLVDRRHKDVVCLAFGVIESRKSWEVYADFVTSLFGGWGWQLRHSGGGSLLFEDEGEAVRVWPVRTMARLAELVSRQAEYGDPYDVIVTNLSVPDNFREAANEARWQLVEHSRLVEWLKLHFPYPSEQPLGPVAEEEA